MSHEFDEDTRVEAVATDRFAATVTDRWGTIGGRPNGGYLLGICMQALRHTLPFPDPLAVSAHFLRPAVPGAARVCTELIRTGRRIATGDARLFQEGRELVRVVASFTDLSLATGRTLLLREPPKLPPPERAIDLLAGGSAPVTGARPIRWRSSRSWTPRGRP